MKLLGSTSSEIQRQEEPAGSMPPSHTTGSLAIAHRVSSFGGFW